MVSGSEFEGPGGRPPGTAATGQAAAHGSIWSDEPVWTPMSPQEASEAAQRTAVPRPGLQPAPRQPDLQPPPMPAQPAPVPAQEPLSPVSPSPAAAAPAPSDRESPPPIVTFEQLTRPPEPPPYAPPHRPAEQPLADLSRAQADKAAGKPDWATLAPRPQPARTQAPEAQPVQAQTVQAQPLQAQPLQAQAIDAQAIHAQAPHPQPGEAPAPGQPQAAAAGTDRASGLGAVAAAVQPTLTVLHVGCGPPNPNALPAALRTQNWRELRLDANAEMQPDIVASITDMRQVADGSMDAVYSSHNLEHVFPHEAPLALAEFCRVLKPDGLCLLLCPDLQTIGQMIAEGRLLEPIYHSPAGPIAPIDMLYGHRASMAAGNLYMAHRNGFSASSLTQLMQEAGFAKVAVTRDPARFSLWGLGFRIDIGDALVARCQANLGIGHPALPPPRG